MGAALGFGFVRLPEIQQKKKAAGVIWRPAPTKRCCPALFTRKLIYHTAKSHRQCFFACSVFLSESFSPEKKTLLARFLF